ncbi:hypothetical protein AB0M80_35360 [Amycolatopsis sp. NPDC051045]|uniref:hypothetical protein n=1 Tax=Amycolatopsis sp. NPDC051045 TaxID=3156922 RepID=UPI00341F78B7
MTMSTSHLSAGNGLQTPFGESLVVGATEPAQSAVLAGTSPFVGEYYSDGRTDEDNPRAAEMVELLDELHDPEFDEALYELVDDVRQAYEQQFDVGLQDRSAHEAAAERFVASYLSGLQEEAERGLDAMAHAAEGLDPAGVTQRELDGLLGEVATGAAALSPVFEDFLGGFFNKVKKVVSKGVKLIGKFHPIAIILRKLKKLVRPLLNRVLRMALDKLPPALRPAASQLATRLLGLKAEAAEAMAPNTQLTTVDPGQVQQELDLGLASLLLAADATQGDVALAEVMSEMRSADGQGAAELPDARERFINEITELGDGEDPSPVIQNFLPAILPALRLGIQLAGRPKVVNFLAGYLAKMIQRFVGPALRRPLSQAIVDAGLRLMTLEVTEATQTRAAGAAVAGTVEDTVRQVAELDEAVLDSQPLLEAALAEAFDGAAAANFPTQLLLPELRETDVNGAWVLLPLRGRPRYKRFSQIFDARITPRTARHVKTFGGVSLDVVLRDRYGVTGPVTARARLYEAIPGSSLARVAAYEQELPEANTAAWSEMQPLTPEAAGLLFGEPGLGREIPTEFMATPRTVAAGQRFYQLAIPGTGAAPTRSTVRGRQLRRSTRLSVSFRFKADEIRVRLYLSEADAQAIAAKVARGSSEAAALARMLFVRVQAGVQEAMSGRFPRRIRFVHESVPQDYQQGTTASRLPEPLRRWLCRTLLRWLHATLTAGFLEQHGRRLADAAANAADGVTILITFAHPPGMKLIDQALRGRLPSLAELVLGTGAAPTATTVITPGHRR